MTPPVPTEALAAVLRGPRSVSIETMPVEAPGANEALIRVDACGVCGSDVPMYTGQRETDVYPLIFGHEIVGTVVAIGSEAAARRRITVGDRILLEEYLPCQTCVQCLAGRHRLCPQALRYGTTPLDQGGALLGGFAEYARVPTHALHHLVPPELDPSSATLAIPLSNGLSWTRDAGDIRPGDSVLVQGPGQTGLACVVAAVVQGAGPVIVSGTGSDHLRLEAALRLGAHRVVNIEQENLLDVVAEVTAGRGADIVIDAAALATTTLPVAIGAAALGGRIILAGAKRGRLTDGVATDSLFKREISIRGVAARRSWALTAALQLLSSKTIDLKPMHGPTFSLDQVEHAVRLIAGELDAPAPVHATITATQGGV